MLIYALSALDDNYIWLVRFEHQIWVIDPGDATPVLEHMAIEGLALTAIVLTHQHQDHWQGVPALVAHQQVPVYGPAAMPAAILPFITQVVAEGDWVAMAGEQFQVLELPGHTAEHIAYFCADTLPPTALVGDTLFAAGCGRAFYSVTALFTSLQRLRQLPAATNIYCSHEYTLANLDFALAVEPANQTLLNRQREAQRLRQKGLPTLPTTLSLEQLTNPFLRLQEPSIKKSAELASKSTLNCDFDVFSALRSWKNRY